MPVVPATSVPNLGDNIALIAIAAMLAVEAWKASERVPRVILTALAIAFALSGALLKSLANNLPAVGAFVANIFQSPVSWFVLAVSLFIVLRPFWHRQVVQAAKNKEISGGSDGEGRDKYLAISISHKKVPANGGYAYFANIEFLEPAQNIVFLLEVFRAEVRGFGQRWDWMRLRWQHPLKRPNCNKGDTETIKLIELAVRTDTSEKQSALPGPITRQRRASSSGRFKAKLTITAAGREPYKQEWIFLWQEQLILMPLRVPDQENGDSSDFEEGECVLWLTP